MSNFPEIPSQLGTAEVPRYSGNLAYVVDGVDIGAAAFNIYVSSKEDPETGEVKRRKIFDPNEEMRELHSRFLTFLRVGCYPEGPDYSLSVRDYIEPHRPNSNLYRIDLSKAYDQVDPVLLAKVLNELSPALGETTEIEDFLRRFCIRPWPCTSGLMTGPNSSPDLFNLYMLPLDEQLTAFCQARKITYTRYMDDLLFSAPDLGHRTYRPLPHINSCMRVVKDMIRDYGLIVNDRKTVKGNISEQPLEISGIQINPDWTYRASTRYLNNAIRRLEALKEAALWCPDKEAADEVIGTAAGIKGVIISRANDHLRFAHPLEARVYRAVKEVIELARQSAAA